MFKQNVPPCQLSFATAMREGVEQPTPLPLKSNDHPIAAGDREVLLTAGGGGYGPPFERDVQHVRADVMSGYVSAGARRIFPEGT